MEVAVIGGSLGGLFAACLLADDQHRVTVYERSSVPLEERGAGIGFLPMTGRYFVEQRGIDLSRMSVQTNAIRHVHRDGSVAHETPHRYLFSSWNTVFAALLDSFDTANYRLAHEMVALDSATATATATFTNGESVTADLMVCADGIGSVARSRLAPGSHPTYAGYVAWRGVVDESALSERTRTALDDAITYYATANSHILVYPIPGRDGSVRPGERLINFVWYRNYLAGDDLHDVLTDVRGMRRDTTVPPGAVRDVHTAEARAVAAARLPAMIAEVVAAAPELFIQVIMDLSVEQMAYGRTCIIGDAAFVARPHAAAGTAKAAADAWALRDALRNNPLDVGAALAAWEPDQLALGRSLTARTQRLGRRSQVDSTWTADDPEIIFGLFRPGD